MISAALDLHRRTRAAQLVAAGWSEAEYRLALCAAADAWLRLPALRPLPRALRARTFPLFGRRFAARYLARWRTGAPMAR